MSTIVIGLLAIVWYVGARDAAGADPGLRCGVNVAGGQVTHAAVAEGVDLPHVPVEKALGAGAPAEA